MDLHTENLAFKYERNAQNRSTKPTITTSGKNLVEKTLAEPGYTSDW